MKHESVVKISLLILILLSVAVLFFPKSSADHDSLSIAVSQTPLSAPVYIAQELGYFKEQNLDLQLQEVIGGYKSFLKMSEDGVDLATSSESVLVFQSFKNIPYVNIATFVQSDNDVKIIARRSSILSPADLAGKKIAVIESSASEYFLSLYLGLIDIDLNEINMIGMQADQMPSALAEGSVDVIVPWEPYGYKASQLLADEAIKLETRALSALTFNFVTRPEVVLAKRKELVRFLKAIDKAIGFIVSNPEESQKIIMKRLELDKGFIDWIWPDYLFRLSLNRSLLLLMNNQAEWLVSRNVDGSLRRPDFEQQIDATLLSSFKHDAVLGLEP